MKLVADENKLDSCSLHNFPITISVMPKKRRVFLLISKGLFRLEYAMVFEPPWRGLAEQVRKIPCTSALPCSIPIRPFMWRGRLTDGLMGKEGWKGRQLYGRPTLHRQATTLSEHPRLLSCFLKVDQLTRVGREIGGCSNRLIMTLQ